jgi:hypothetical protein
VVADIDVGANASPTEHVRERPDARSRTDVSALETGIGVHEHPFRLRARITGYVRQCALGESAGLLRRTAHRRQANTTFASE